MSGDVAEVLVARMRSDPRFRDLLTRDPRRALRGQGLTREQVERVLGTLADETSASVGDAEAGLAALAP